MQVTTSYSIGGPYRLNSPPSDENSAGTHSTKFSPVSDFRTTFTEDVKITHHWSRLSHPGPPQELKVLNKKYPGALDSITKNEVLSSFLGFGVAHTSSAGAGPRLPSTREVVAEKVQELSRRHPVLLSTRIEDYDYEVSEERSKQLLGKLQDLFPTEEFGDLKISARAKTPKSLKRKMQNRGPKTTLGSVVDTVGARVDAADLHTLKSVSRRLETALGDRVLAKLDYFQAPQENGYRALHYLIDAGDRIAEVQLTTHNLRAADLTTHDTLYKKEIDYKEESHSLIALAGDRAYFLDSLHEISAGQNLDGSSYGGSLQLDSPPSNSLRPTQVEVKMPLTIYEPSNDGIPMDGAWEKPDPAEKAKENEIRQAVRERLEQMGDYFRGYHVDSKLLPHLNELGLDPVEFFLARACWQGTQDKKRRKVLESVLDQLHSQPLKQKDWRTAVQKAADSGTQIHSTDKVFLQFFFENRKELKSLFQATLPAPWKGADYVTVYRGQRSDPWDPPREKDSVKGLGCYTLNPTVASHFGVAKEYKVSVDDVWSTSWATQNRFWNEEELTVYTPSRIRSGTPVELPPKE